MDAAQGGCELGLITGKEDRFYGLEGVQAHSGRAAPGKKAKDHLFPEVGVCSSLANHLKFGQPLADLRPAFGNTIVSTHPDGRKAKLWLNADHTYSAQGRNGKRSAGVWRTRTDKLCLSQRKPYPGLFTICRKIPLVSVGHSWSGTAVTGEPVTNAVVAGR